MKIKYTIENYDSEWINKFQQIKTNLEKIFGSKAVDIQHVGSTSVPGMKAKPLIDILVIAKQWEDFEKEKSEMIKLGYQLRLNVLTPDSLLFEKVLDNHKIENVHVFKQGAEKIKEFLDIRDYLRIHPEMAEIYGNLKKELLAKYPDDYFAYREGKQDFLGELKRLAHEWR